MKSTVTVGFYVGDKETEPGVWQLDIVERLYYAEVLKKSLRWQTRTESLTDDLTVSNRISIISDLYARQNWPSIRYVVWNGVKWKVTNVEVDYPRVIFDVGEVYNGN